MVKNMLITPKPKNQKQFKIELAGLLKKYNYGDNSITPDYILAEYLLTCLKNFNNTTNSRTSWYNNLTEIDNAR